MDANTSRETGMDRASARKRKSWDEDTTTEPMRPAARGQIARNPSTDQKRVRREMARKTAMVTCAVCSYSGESHSSACAHCGSLDTKIATRFDTQAWRLNPGDKIQLSNGQTQQVTRVRPHENGAGSHVYVDTDGGTTLAHRNDNFTVVPSNTLQQTSPGYGTPGGNFNYLPWDRTPGGSSTGGCPRCGGHLVRRGDHFQCGNCGYQQQQGGASGHSFSPHNQIITTFSTVNQELSAVALRSRHMLDTTLDNQGDTP